MITDNTIISKPNSDLFTAKLLTNPVNDQLKFTVNVKDMQTTHVMIMDISGRILKSDKRTLSPGTNMFFYNTGTWAQGIYMIRIATENGFTSVLKAVK